MARPTHEDVSGDLGRSPQAQARRDREREESNDRRSQDVFRGLSYLKAQVELEFAWKTSKELARSEAAAQEINEEHAQTKKRCAGESSWCWSCERMWLCIRMYDLAVSPISDVGAVFPLPLGMSPLLLVVCCCCCVVVLVLLGS